MKKLEKEKGSLTLEASIVLTMFMMMMMALYCVFFALEAMNTMASVTLATADSLSKDPVYFLTMTKPEDGDIKIKDLIMMVSERKDKENGDFVRRANWTTGDEAAIAALVEQRFNAYLAGGDDADVKYALKRLGIEDVDFSKSEIAKDPNGKKYIHVVVEYNLKLKINPFGIGVIKQRSETKSLLWWNDVK